MITNNDNNRILISDLTITQEFVHTVEQIPAMVEHVQNGGYFTQELLDDYAACMGIKSSGLIKITVFEDGAKYIQDGHHRCLSILIGGRDYIHPSEFIYEYWTYKDYEEVNFDNKWVTPINVKTHVRKSDFKKFKRKAMLLKDVNYILSNTELYMLPRKIHSVIELKELYHKIHKRNKRTIPSV